MAGRLDMVNVLLESGWELAINETCGALKRTALSIAVHDERYAIASALLKREDIDSNIGDKTGKNAFNYATDYSSADKVNQEKEKVAIEIINHKNTNLNQNFDGLPALINLHSQLPPASILNAYIKNPNAQLVFPNEGKVEYSLLAELLKSPDDENLIQTLLDVNDREVGINWSPHCSGTALSQALRATTDIEGDFHDHFHAINLVGKFLQRQDLDVNIPHNGCSMIDALFKTAIDWADHVDSHLEEEDEEDGEADEPQESPQSEYHIGFKIINKFISNPKLELDPPAARKIFNHLINNKIPDYKSDCSDSINLLIERKIDKLLEESDAAGNRNLLPEEKETTKFLKIEYPYEKNEILHFSPTPNALNFRHIPPEYSFDEYPPMDGDSLVQLCPLASDSHMDNVTLTGSAAAMYTPDILYLG